MCQQEVEITSSIIAAPDLLHLTNKQSVLGSPPPDTTGACALRVISSIRQSAPRRILTSTVLREIIDTSDLMDAPDDWEPACA